MNNGLVSASEFLAAGIELSGLARYYVMIVRIVLPVIAVLILYRCARSFFSEKTEKEVWGYLTLPNGSRIELNHWENIIGRAKSSDILLEYPTLSRTHAAFIRDAKGRWTVYDLNSKGGVTINGKRVEGSAPVNNDDVLSLGGVETVFISLSQEQEIKMAHSRKRPGAEIKPGKTLMWLSYFQILLTAELLLSDNVEEKLPVFIGFAGLCLIMWAYYLFMKMLGRTGMEAETVAFFLSTIGMEVCASSTPGDMYKQLMIVFAGVIGFLIIGWILRDLDRVKKLRWPIAAAGIALLAVNVVLAKTTFGARNWLSIGGTSVQPSEIVKICFVFAGAATLDRMFAKRNVYLFVAYAAVCVGALALISDFGTAATFFVCYLIISFMRSGDIATAALSIGGAGLAGFLVLTVKPYIKKRFATWGKAWEYMNEGGYQQTRTMAALASGGLLGVGAGNGWLKQVFAANTDMVFGMVSEELGFIIALSVALAIALVAVFAISSSANARSSFYAIGACAAVSIMLSQTMLNIFGSLDILPFTGVTLPFISKGGTSILSCWGLLAFVKAADTRQNASFAIKLPKHFRKFMAVDDTEIPLTDENADGEAEEE